jgi:hypothetical protein
VGRMKAALNACEVFVILGLAAGAAPTFID